MSTIESETQEMASAERYRLHRYNGTGSALSTLWVAILIPKAASCNIVHTIASGMEYLSGYIH